MTRALLAATLLIGTACSPTNGDQAPVDAIDTPAAASSLELPNLRYPLPSIRTAGHISAADIDALGAAGVRHVIDLTLDSETPGFDEAAAMRAAGIAYDNLPIGGPAALTRENVQAFDALVTGAARPLLVHCASSNRVGAMAALRAAWIQGRPVEEAIAIGHAWGLQSLEGAVRERLEAGQ